MRHLLIGSLVFSAQSLIATEGNACDVVPPGAYLSGLATSIPTEGAIAANIICTVEPCSSFEAGFPILVEADSGHSFEIEVTSVTPINEFSVAAVWQPDEPFEEGVRYGVSLKTPDRSTPLDNTTFVAVAPLGDETPTVEAQFSMRESIVGVGEPVCCTLTAANACGGDERCLPSDYERRVAMNLDFSEVYSAWRSQFEFRAVFTAENERLEEEDFRRGAIGVLATVLDAKEYCYELFARRINDTGPELRLDEGCLPLSEVEPTTAFSDRYNSLSECMSPPESLEAEWCAELDRNARAREDCEKHRECADSRAACIDSAEVADDPEPEETEARDVALNSSAEDPPEGCSFNSASSNRRSGPFALALLGLAIAARRLGRPRIQSHVCLSPKN